MLDATLIAALLRAHADFGCDEAIADIPTDWSTAFSPPARAAPQASAVAPGSGAGRVAAAPLAFPTPPAEAPLGAAEAGAAARERARAAATLEELEAALRAFEGCPLKTTAMHTVFGDGPAKSRVMFVGEAPGEDEDRQGHPFVGVSGKLLDRMLGHIGIERETVRVTNILPWRPPGNRGPTQAETAACLPFLIRHIELVEPEIVVPLGGTAAKTVLNRPEGITRLRGRWFETPLEGVDRPVFVLPMLHPAYLLRNPVSKREAWKDLLTLRRKLSEA